MPGYKHCLLTLKLPAVSSGFYSNMTGLQACKFNFLWAWGFPGLTRAPHPSLFPPLTCWLQPQLYYYFKLPRFWNVARFSHSLRSITGETKKLTGSRCVRIEKVPQRTISLKILWGGREKNYILQGTKYSWIPHKNVSFTPKVFISPFPS